MRILIMVPVLLAATFACAKTFWIKNGTTDWTKAESYLAEDQSSSVVAPPGEGDLVAIPSGQTTVYLDAADTASWTLVNKLSQIAPRGTSSKLVITVAEGEATLSVPVTIFDTLLPGMTSKYSSIATAEKYGTLVKRGDGGLKLASAGALISGSASACDYLTGIDIQAGTLLLPQAAAGKLSFYLGSLVVATNATFFTCRNVDNNTSYAATYVRSFAGGGVITNDNPGALAANSKQYYFGATRAETNEVFTGRIDGAIRPIMQGLATTLGTNSMTVGSATLNGGEWRVASIGLKGKPSSLGAGNHLYVRESGGTLRYVGEGEQVTRPFDFAPATKPFVIDAGPVGGLDISGPWVNNYGSSRQAGMRNLVLTGSNTVPCTVNVEMETESLYIQGTNFTCYMTKEGSGTWRFKDSAKHINDNGFWVKEGTLQYDSIDEIGTVCALGTATNLTDGYIGSFDPTRAVTYAFKLGGEAKSGAANEATFEFTGTNRSWCSSRPFVLAGDARIKNDTDRPLRLMDLKGLGEGNRTVTFCGAGTNEFYDIADGTSTVSVRKTGSGDWTIGGDLSFSGALSVDEGKLTVRKSGKYEWFRWTIKEECGADKNEFQVDEFALLSEGAIRQNLFLTEALDRELIQPGEAAFQARRPLIFSENTTGGKTYDGRLPLLFSAYNEYGLRVSVTKEGTSATKAHSSVDDPTTWIPIVMRLTNGAPEIVAFDYVNVYGSGKEAPSVKAYSLEGSVNGLQWDELYATNDAPVASASWYWTSSNKRFQNNEVKVSSSTGYPIRGHSLRTFDTLSHVSEISVAAGATLEVVGLADGEMLPLKDGVKLTVDCSKTTGTATIRGLAFPENGTVDLVNVPKGKGAFVPMDTSASDGFVENVSNWTVTVDGQPTVYEVSVGPRGLTVTPPGMVIFLK